MANKCPICGGSLKIATKKEDGCPSYLRCADQKTEKNGKDFVEVGKCKFKINFNTKFYNLTKEEMKRLLNGADITIKDDNILKLDVKSKMFTKIEFTEKYIEDDF